MMNEEKASFSPSADKGVLSQTQRNSHTTEICTPLWGSHHYTLFIGERKKRTRSELNKLRAPKSQASETGLFFFASLLCYLPHWRQTCQHGSRFIHLSKEHWDLIYCQTPHTSQSLKQHHSFCFRTQEMQWLGAFRPQANQKKLRSWILDLSMKIFKSFKEWILRPVINTLSSCQDLATWKFWDLLRGSKSRALWLNWFFLPL